MKTIHVLALAAAALFGAACSSTPSNNSNSSAAAASPAAQPTAAAAPAATNGARMMKSRDGKYEGEVIGTAAPNAKFSKLVIGMETPEVQDVMGRTPDRSHTYESGKRWIPFYFGNDARRMQVLYKGEGCLIFTNGNAWGGGGGDLIQITFDPSGACYQQ
jgi:hypothetical protein